MSELYTNSSFNLEAVESTSLHFSTYSIAEVSEHFSKPNESSGFWDKNVSLFTCSLKSTLELSLGSHVVESNLHS